MADNLIKKKGESMWYVSLAIPKDVQKSFGGRKKITKSLKTGLRSEAMERRLRYLAKWKKQIVDARAGRSLPNDWEDEISQALANLEEIKRLKKRQLIGESVDILNPSPPYPTTISIRLSFLQGCLRSSVRYRSTLATR